MNQQISSPAVAVLRTVKPTLSTSTDGQSGSPLSGNWLRLGDVWAVRQEHIVLLGSGPGPEVRAYLDIGQVIEIEVPIGHGAKVTTALRDGQDLPANEVVNVSVTSG